MRRDLPMMLLRVMVGLIFVTEGVLKFVRPEELGVGRFAAPAKLAHYGWGSFLHEARVDLCMLLGTLAVLLDAGLKVGRRRPWYQSKGL